jgi:iron complex transport system substrate-binding protein
MVTAAGGEDVLGRPGERSRVVDWPAVAAGRPEVVVTMPCGLYVDQAAEEAARHAGVLESLGAARVVAVDAASSFSRPGPRLVDGVELLAHLLHPDSAPAPRGIGWREVALAAAS